MSNDRRSDLGNKITIGLLLSGASVILGMLANAAYGAANEGRTIGHENKNEITALKSTFDYIKDDLGEIKAYARASARRSSQAE